MKFITSTANPTIKEIRKLRNRKERESTNTYFLEGIRIVTEAVQQKAHVHALIHAPELLTSSYGLDVVKEFASAGGNVLEVSSEVFASIAQKDHPQGLAAVAQQEWLPLDQVVIQPGDVWVVLDTVRDPGNLGTILRTLDAVSGTGVVLLDDTCDPYDPTAIRASMGAIFTQNLVKTNLTTFADWKNKNSIHLVGTSDHEGRIHYRKMIYPNPVFLLMGSERAGLSDAHIAICDAMVMIPMSGVCDSLNLSVATGIVLYEIYEQLHGKVEKA